MGAVTAGLEGAVTLGGGGRARAGTRSVCREQAGRWVWDAWC